MGMAYSGVMFLFYVEKSWLVGGSADPEGNPEKVTGI